MAQTQMEKCLECVINIYHQYSVRVDHHDMLSKGELKKLIQEQLPNYLKSEKDPKTIEKIFQELDKDKSKQITFEEFMVLLTKVLIAAHKLIHEKEDGHCHGPGPGHCH